MPRSETLQDRKNAIHTLEYYKRYMNFALTSCSLNFFLFYQFEISFQTLLTLKLFLQSQGDALKYLKHLNNLLRYFNRHTKFVLTSRSLRANLALNIKSSISYCFINFNSVFGLAQP